MTRFIFLVCAVAHAAGAAEVYLNGTNVEGLTNQAFEKVNVRIDEKGNVYIEAPGYTVKRVALSADKESKPPARMTQQYFLVTEQTEQGATDFDIDVYVNGALLRTLASNDSQLVADITKDLVVGKNQVLLQGKKLPPGSKGRKSQSPSAVFRVLVGEGRLEGDKVVIEKSMLTFSVSAADESDVAKRFDFTTR